MRYRPFGHSGRALSATGLRLPVAAQRRNANHARKLIETALENGINTFHFDGLDLDFLKMAAQVFSVVDRKVLFISLTPDLPGVPGDLAGYAFPVLKEALRGVIKSSGLQWLDLLLFVQPGAAHLPADSLAFVQELKKARMLRHVGTTADTEELLPAIEGRRFDVIVTPFDIDSAWDKRHGIDKAIRSDMMVIGTDYFPEMYRKASDVIPKKARGGWFSKPADPLAGAGTHAFLHTTDDWTPEELCLGYALSLPSLSCILIEAETPEKLEKLAEVPERHLPSSVPAQIEMARFTHQLPKGAQK
jgi:aryl-alcohol dehydrogenase-like predicted oxidoreductase